MRAFVLFATLATLATPAAAYRAINGLFVDPTGPQEFLVDYERVENETAYWCAAGDFVIHGLGLPSKTRVYRASPPPRRAGQGITFTIDPAAAAEDSGLTIYSRDGDGSLSAGQARAAFCNFYDNFYFY